MVSERLHVIRDDVLVGVLDRGDDERLQFTFSEHAVDVAEGNVLVSASLPVRRQPYSEGELLPFFEGLLPEGLPRERLARRLRLEPNDVFGFLREIGLDCAGAFSIVPEGFDAALARQEGVEWLSEEELAAKIRELAARPLAVEPERDIRISLAGAQDKMAVVVEEGRIGLPRGTTPSTHILKPASQVLREGPRAMRLAYPALVANEAFCMKLSHLTGLRTAAVDVVSIAGAPALLIERYDRERNAAAKVLRIHQEDFCQALGIASRKKYQKDGGPGLPEFLELLQRHSTMVTEDEPELISRVAFNYAVGNADAHAKNFSILYPGSRVRLAPAYDLISTHVYDQLSHDMATSINRMFDIRAIEPIYWQKELTQLGLRQRFYAGRLADLAERIGAALPAALDWINEKELADRRVDAIAQLVRRRLRVLRGISALPPPTVPTKGDGRGEGL